MVTFECIGKSINFGKCDNSNSGTHLGKHKSLIFNIVRQMATPRLGIFTALHGMQRGLNDEISVRLSVRLSVCLSVCLPNACIVTKRKKDMF